MTENLAVQKHPGGRPVVFGIDNPCWKTICEQMSIGKNIPPKFMSFKAENGSD